MASEYKFEDVLLTGQTGYFKKSGSMVNRGVIHVENTNTSYTYGEGFVDVGSKIDGHPLEYTNEYKECVIEMKSYLLEHYDDTTPGYEIVNNCQMMQTKVTPKNEYFEGLFDKKYEYLDQISVSSNPKFTNLSFDLNEDFVIDLDLLFKTTEVAYDILTSDDTDFSISRLADGKLNIFGNEVEIKENIRTKINIRNENSKLYITIDKNHIIEGVEGFNVEKTITLFNDNENGFRGNIYSVILYNLNDTVQEKICRLIPCHDIEDDKLGLYDTLEMEFYEAEEGVALYVFVDKVLARAYAALDTELNLTNYGVEIELEPYNQYTEYEYGESEEYYQLYPFGNVTSSSYRPLYLSLQKYDWGGGLEVYGDGYYYDDGMQDYEIYDEESAELVLGRKVWKYNIDSKFSIGDLEVTNALVPYSGTNISTLKLFSYGSTSYSACTTYMYLYNCKVYDNTQDEPTLVAEFKPAKDFKGKGCLYDTVSERLFYPMNANYPLIPGNEVID